MSICREVVVETFTLTELMGFCAEELGKHRQKQPTDGYCCVELVRRAAVLRTDEVWEALARLFHETVLIWLRAHPNYDLAIIYDSEDNYVALMLTRFWSAMRDQHLRFITLPTLLSYLHATLNSTVIDTIRVSTRTRCVSLLDPVVAESADLAQEERYDDDYTWNTIQRLLESEKERRLMYLLYYCGLKPREIAARFPARFPDVKEVYRLNHAIIERLRRKRDRLRWLLGDQEAEAT